MSSLAIHEREQDEFDSERYAKRLKLDDCAKEAVNAGNTIRSQPSILPPSHALLGIPPPIAQEGHPVKFLEADVGISEYIGRGEAKIEGIIKQRFTDFLVYEVDQDGHVIHLENIAMPVLQKKERIATETCVIEPKKADEESTHVGTAPQGPTLTLETDIFENDIADAHESESNGEKQESNEETKETWPDRFNSLLAPFLDEERILQLKQMYAEGPEPPRLSDSGWAGRVPAPAPSDDVSRSEDVLQAEDRDERSGRGAGHGGRRGGRVKGSKGNVVDTRKVLSDPISSKDIRTAFHKTIRELFEGKLDTETDTLGTTPEGGSRILVKWARKGSGRGAGRSGHSATSRAARGTYPPYIHFTMQKTNRDTQDALGHLSRNLHVNLKDLAVAGTKDKRGVTVQRVSLKRGGKTVEDVWRLANNLGSRRSLEDVMTQRGERGIRIADLRYRKAALELGMLKGNAFVITLRSVKVESTEVLNEAMETIKNKGFINYYGMQRFGTASVPTHAIGLALLQSDWQRAADMILQKRHGEHPDVEAARDAWLVEGDLDKALSLLPRRVVAERCILENFKKQKGDTRNVMGALSTIPRNLRLMYIHAYQSYVWNAIVSERIRMYGSDRPVVGDLVYEKKGKEVLLGDSEDCMLAGTDEIEGTEPSRRSRKRYEPPQMKTLTEEDLEKYTIFDVVMPLPGTDVAYPGGELGERYREFLRMDGLDPDNFVRKQKDYILNGSYRAIIHLPKELSWSTLRYTDPDVPLAQSDEDKLLGFDPPAVVHDGKFVALQINLILGTAAYATMALREITKTDTSSHVQTSLTASAEDQKYRGTGSLVLEMTEEYEAAIPNAKDDHLI